MGPYVAAAIPATISAFGSWFGGERANAANAHQAHLNRVFQERMSNTQYQRAVADMRAAGLNPALAYQQGGAGTPGGATAAPAQNSLGAGATSAVATAEAMAGIAQTKANIEKTEAETVGIDTESRLKKTLAKYEMAARLAEITSRGNRAAMENNPKFFATILAQMESDLKLTQTSARGAAADATLRELSIPQAEADAWKAGTWIGKYVSPWMNDAKSAAMIGAGAAAPFVLRGRAALEAARAAKKGKDSFDALRKFF